MDIRNIVTTALFGLVVSVLSLVFTQLWDYIWKPFKVVQSMKLLREAMKDLEARYDDVKLQVAQAEFELKTCIREIKRWLEKVESIRAEVIYLDAEYLDLRSYGVVYNYFIFWKRYNVGYKVLDKLRAVTKLHEEGGAFKEVAIELPPPAAKLLPSTPGLRAIDSNRDQILQYLKDDEAKIIGIWGMGGVGKTTLLKEINNYFAHSRIPLFDHVMFVVASKDINPEELQKKMLKNLRLPSEMDHDISSRATLLFNFLKNRKVLLLLDDLWKHVNLVDLGIPLERGRCKVVFTTRSKDVCGSMKTTSELKVECLNTSDAWSLFQANIGENIIKDDPNIGCLAKEVAKECCGLPLALITIGRVMSAKKTWREWQNALNLLCNSRHNEISSVSDDMFPILEFSYQNLQDDIMKECFLTCCLWPEDWEIPKHELIICWMGLGLIDDYNEINEAYDKGYSIIESLTSACLLEHYVRRVDEPMEIHCVKIHDVLRDLALWIASDYGKNRNKWMVQANVGLKECKVDKWKGPHRISLMFNELKSLPEQLPECPKLSVLMLNGNLSLRSIPQELFHCLRSLTYLNLEGSLIQELPVAIGKLVSLQFLNLRHNRIGYLPDELSNLVHLKYLLLGYTYIWPIPWKLIWCLSKLKVLDLFGCSGTIEMESLGGFKELEYLDGKLMGLWISINTTLALNRLSMFSTVSIVMLQIRNLECSESLELLSPALFGSKSTADGLQLLDFCSCKTLKVLVVDSLHLGGIQRPKSLPRLEVLELGYLTLLEKIVWRGVTPNEFLPSLRSLLIDGCHKLKDVSWVLQLPNLEFLRLNDCNELEMVVGDVVGDGGGAREIVDKVEEPILAFPKLRTLELIDLENLGSICSTDIAFPSLEGIAVDDCPKLKSLPFQVPNFPNKLQRIWGSIEWWGHLDWEDDNTCKSLLQKYFNAFAFEGLGN